MAGYVAVMHLNQTLVAVRGGLTTGPWTERESGIVGERLQAEIGGTYLASVTAELWKAKAGPILDKEIGVSEYFALACPEDCERVCRQYKADSLVTGEGLEV